MAPMTTRAGALWSAVDGFRATLFPYVDGHDAVDVPLADRHGQSFGSALRAIHTVVLPAALLDTIRREAYSAEFRDAATRWLQVAADCAQDAVSRRLPQHCMRSKCEEVFLTAAGDDREQSVDCFERQFEAGGVVEIAHATLGG